MAHRKLSERQRKLVDRYFKNGGNKKEACIYMGYSDADAHAGVRFNHPAVQEEIARRRAKLEKKFDLSLDEILNRYLAIADAHIRLAKYKKVKKGGEIEYDFTDADPEDMAYINASVSDAKAALDSIAKLMGYDKQKVEISGKDGGPVEIKMDDKELARKLAFILTRGSKKEETV